MGAYGLGLSKERGDHFLKRFVLLLFSTERHAQQATACTITWINLWMWRVGVVELWF